MKCNHCIVALICLPLLTAFTPSLSQKIKGIVLDSESSEGIPYVNIWFKGTTMGTYSNGSGQFEIANLGDTLVLSMVGYGRKEIDLKAYVSMATVREEKEIVVYLDKSTIFLDPIIFRPKQPQNHKTYGFKGSSLYRLTSVIGYDFFQMYKVVIWGKPGQHAFIETINFKLETFAPNSFPLIIELFLSKGKEEIPLLNSPIYLRIRNEDLSSISVDLLSNKIEFPENDQLNVYLTLLGFEEDSQKALLPGSVTFMYSKKKTKDQRTFMRRSKDIPWDKSTEFFKNGSSFKNLNLWVQVVW